jgi:hypothetical protein
VDSVLVGGIAMRVHVAGRNTQAIDLIVHRLCDGRRPPLAQALRASCALPAGEVFQGRGL